MMYVGRRILQRSASSNGVPCSFVLLRGVPFQVRAARLPRRDLLASRSCILVADQGAVLESQAIAAKPSLQQTLHGKGVLDLRLDLG
jgi:hypothetical protein